MKRHLNRPFAAITEALEPRRLLSAPSVVVPVPDSASNLNPTITIGVLTRAADITHTGTLVIHGTADADAISVSGAGSELTILNGKSITTVKDSAFNRVKRILVEGGGGDDRISVSADLHATLMGGSGDDVLVAGRGDVLVGGKGNDKLVAGIAGSSITLISGAETQTIESGAASELHGGAGRDRLYAFEKDSVEGGGGDDQAVLYQFIIGTELPDEPADAAAFAQSKLGSRASGIDSFTLERKLFKTRVSSIGHGTITATFE